MPTIFHDEAIEIAVAANEVSATKFAETDRDLRRDAMFLLTHDAVRVHRAVGCLVDHGWAGPGAALVRTLIDLAISAMAITSSQNPRMAAFKYLYSGFRRHARDQSLLPADRRRMFSQIRMRLAQLPDHLRDEAAAVVRQKDRSYWFALEWANPSAVLDACAAPGLRWTYMQMSAAAHGAVLGMRLFRDEPDTLSLNPDRIGPRAFSLDLTSCRWLVEIVRVRAIVEGLDLMHRIDDFVERLSQAVQELPKS